jgi:Activator of Hsp90 ATPase homolog 1-like protein
MPAPREIVFEAWIDANGIRKWMCPGEVISVEVVLEDRVGGSFRIVMKSKEQRARARAYWDLSSSGTGVEIGFYLGRAGDSKGNDAGDG